MKKIFTLFAGLLMTAAVFAADRRPTVTVTSSKNYKIVIDGKSYFGSITNLSLAGLYGNRSHTIKVYEMKKGFFVRERLVDAASFQVGRNDLMIKIDYSGQIRIREMKDMGRNDRNDRGNQGWDDKRWDSGRDYDSHNSGGDRDNSHDSRDGRGRGF